MSLAIDPEKVVSVMIGNEWHQVKPGSFHLDAFEFVYDSDNLSTHDIVLGGGQDPLTSATGAQWAVRGKTTLISCPLRALQAVSHGR